MDEERKNEDLPLQVPLKKSFEFYKRIRKGLSFLTSTANDNNTGVIERKAIITETRVSFFGFLNGAIVFHFPNPLENYNFFKKSVILKKTYAEHYSKMNKIMTTRLGSFSRAG